jgi:hypothetical protein
MQDCEYGVRIRKLLAVIQIHKVYSTQKQLVMQFCSISSDTVKKNKLRGFSPQTNYTDRATAACRRS